MKKFFVLAFLFILSIGLTSCGKKDQSADADESASNVDTIVDTAVVDDISSVPEDAVDEVSTDTWHLFETDLFSVKYPDGFEPAEYGKFVTFSPRDFEKGQGFYWTVNVVPNRESTVENMITGMGAQYAKDRNVERSEIEIGQLDALRVLVTTERDASFYYEAVFVETDANVYFISNTREKDPAFTAFYGSFGLK